MKLYTTTFTKRVNPLLIINNDKEYSVKIEFNGQSQKLEIHTPESYNETSIEDFRSSFVALNEAYYYILKHGMTHIPEYVTLYYSQFMKQLMSELHNICGREYPEVYSTALFTRDSFYYDKDFMKLFIAVENLPFSSSELEDYLMVQEVKMSTVEANLGLYPLVKSELGLNVNFLASNVVVKYSDKGLYVLDPEANLIRGVALLPNADALEEGIMDDGNMLNYLLSLTLSTFEVDSSVYIMMANATLDHILVRIITSYFENYEVDLFFRLNYFKHFISTYYTL